MTGWLLHGLNKAKQCTRGRNAAIWRRGNLVGRGFHMVLHLGLVNSDDLYKRTGFLQGNSIRS